MNVSKIINILLFLLIIIIIGIINYDFFPGNNHNIKLGALEDASRSIIKARSKSTKFRILTYTFNNKVDILNTIINANADIVCLQNFPIPSQIRDSLFEIYNSITRCETSNSKNTMILSKYDSVDSICFEGGACQIINDNISIYNIYEKDIDIDNIANLMQDDHNPKILIGKFDNDVDKKIKSAKFKKIESCYTIGLHNKAKQIINIDNPMVIMDF
jgi:hypothetical protein